MQKKFWFQLPELSFCRRLNPDILSDNEMLVDFEDICILPQVCGNSCGHSPTCSRVPIQSDFLS